MYPAIFENAQKLDGRRKLWSRSYDLYDGSPNDPTSAAQNQVLELAAQANGSGTISNGSMTTAAEKPVPKEQPAPDTIDANGKAHTPAPAEKEGTPAEGEEDADADQHISSKVNPIDEMIKTADIRDSTLPILSMIDAINISIAEGAKGDDRKIRDFYGGIMTVGGGSLVNNFHQFLEEELKTSRPGLKKAGELLVNLPPREIDPQVLCWKGASIFGKLTTNDAWVTRTEHELMNSRILTYKCIFNW